MCNTVQYHPLPATQSWLLSLFLDCPARIGIACPNATTVEEVSAALQRGDISYHALPHNGQVRAQAQGAEMHAAWAGAQRLQLLLLASNPAHSHLGSQPTHPPTHHPRLSYMMPTFSALV